MVKEFVVVGIVFLVVDDLEVVVVNVDIVVIVMMVCELIFRGDWVKFGIYVDLIGVFKVDMCEVDDDLILIGILFVDSCDIMIDYIGEFKILIVNGVIKVDVVKVDFYDFVIGFYLGC